MIIKALDEASESRWDRFVLDRADSTLFQTVGWKKVVEKTYRHKPYYLYAEDKETLSGVLPLFLVNSLFFGRRLISVPYGPYGGCLASERSAASALLERAADIAASHHTRYIELRNTENSEELPTNDKHVTLLLDLTQGEDKIWSNLRKGMKACIKKAAKEDFTFNLTSKNIRDFYAIYCRRMHALGTPAPPLSFFSNTAASFPDMNIATIEYKGQILATQFLLYFKKTVIYAWGASLNRFAELHPVHALLWKVIQKSVSDGYEVFDFGRSSVDSGTYDFKKWWGAEPRPLFYQYLMNKTGEIPYIHPSNPKYNLMIKTWQKMPLPLVNRLGPYASRELV